MARQPARPNPSKLRAVETVDGWMEKPPREVQVWLKKHGLPPHALPATLHSKKSIEMKLRAQGVWEEASRWKIDATRELTRKLPTTMSWNVAREVSWRVLEDWASLNKNTILAMKQQVVSEDKVAHLAPLPEDIRWVYLHPGLSVKDIADPVVAPAVKKYEDANSCPNQGVRSRYNFLRENPRELQKFFEEVDRLLLAASRPTAKASAGEEEADEEGEAIADIERQIAGEMAGWKEDQL